MSPLLFLVIVLPAPAPAAVPRTSGKILDCTSHSVWREPDGWTTSRAGGETFAVSPDKHAALVRTAVRSERDKTVATPAGEARAIAKRIAGVEVTWGTPAITKKDNWEHTIVVDGTAPNLAVRIVHRERGYGKAIVWVEVADGADRTGAIATMDTARTTEQQLVDHACVCGNDCYTRQK